jgi:hypothetical protein
MGEAAPGSETAGDEEGPTISVQQSRATMLKMAGNDDVEEVLDEEEVPEEERVTFSHLVKLVLKAKFR